VSLFVHLAHAQMVRDFAIAELNALDGLTRHVAMTAEGAALVARLRTNLLALLGDAKLVAERGSVSS